MSVPSQATNIVLHERPKEGLVTSTTFVKKTVPLTSTLAPGELLIRVDWLSLDPAMRGWLNDVRGYVAPVQIGEVMRAIGLGTVVKANGVKAKVGDVVRGTFGWRDYVIVQEKTLDAIIPKGSNGLDFLGTLGIPGLTAYFGLLDIGNIQPGETLVVSGAAGAVGSVVCQIGKIRGARVIALAGSDEKIAWLENELGVDKGLNYKSPTFVADFEKHVGYLDVYFDNVGGKTLDLCLERLNKGARIALCGAISGYNEAKPEGLRNYLNLVFQRAKIHGFLVFDYADRFDEAIRELAKWIDEGKIKRRFHIAEGLEKCPEYMNILFSGGNTGKLVVKVSKDARAELEA